MNALEALQRAIDRAPTPEEAALLRSFSDQNDRRPVYAIEVQETGSPRGFWRWAGSLAQVRLDIAGYCGEIQPSGPAWRQISAHEWTHTETQNHAPHVTRFWATSAESYKP